MTQLTITQARRALLDLPEQLAKSPDKAMNITRHGRPVLVLLPWELYESIIETLDELSDPDTTAALRSNLEDIRKGRLVSHEAARKTLVRCSSRRAPD
jgi:PHD/YefM family antitoxin component YafN of YafNO toxin-antitoxin module